MKTLIGMTDFVIEQWSINLTPIQRDRIKNYANFLKQPLQLWMLVPCDEDGNVLVETTQFDPDETSQYYAQQVWDNKQYQQAKERCLFEGFVYEKDSKMIISDGLGLDSEDLYLMKIEDIAEYKPLLTATAQKSLGL